jgi:acyl carrier protein
VKLRGFRIELGEIEVALRRHADVDDAIVDVRKDATGADQLVAYLVCKEAPAPSRQELASFLSASLPSYMIPAALMAIDEIPLNANGKRDRTALADPPRAPQRRERAPKAPATSIERDLVELFQRELAMEEALGIRDTFAELGVDSLKAANLLLAVEAHFGVELSEAAMASGDSAELLGLYIEQARAATPTARLCDRSIASSIRHKQLSYLSAWTGWRHSADSLIFVRNAQGRAAPLFWCCQGDREHAALADHIGGARPVYAMRSGHLILSYTPDNIAALAGLYADEMIQLQPEGPFWLGGNCQGGTIARETALQLRARGREVALLWMMEQGRFPAYDGPVALIFGAESHLNPYLALEDPDRIFRAAYGSDYSVDFIPGRHGEYFASPSVNTLAALVQSRLPSPASTPLPATS